MKKEMIYSIILIVVILGSVIAMSAGARQDSPSTEVTPDANYDSIPLETYAGEVESTVLETFPEIIIASKTEVYDKAVIENEILTITGVKRITVDFSKLQDETIIMVARAVVDEKLLEEVVEKISNLDYLTSEPVEFYKQGTILLDKNVLFKNVTDGNKSINYSFIDYRIDAILGINSIKKDVVSGQIQGSFRGESPEQLVFYESINVTNSPQLVSGKVNLDVLEWKEDYLFTFKSNFKDSLTSQEMEALLGVDKEIELSKKMILKYSSFEGNIKDVNYENITNIEKEEDAVIINLKEELSVEEYQKTLDFLQEKGLLKENISLEPETYYFVETENLLENYENKILEKGISLESIRKKALFDIEKIDIEGKTYNYKEGLKDVWFDYPLDVEKTNFDLTANAYVSRNNILFIMLEKIKE